MSVFRILALCTLTMLLACTPDYTPSKRVVYSHQAPTEEQNVELAREAWLILGNGRRKHDWPAATQQYNQALFRIVQRLRYEHIANHGYTDLSKPHPFSFTASPYTTDRDTQIYEDMIPCSEIDASAALNEHVYVEGVGIPLAAVVKTTLPKKHPRVLKDSGNIHTLTVILDFRHLEGNKPAMRLIPRLNEDTIRIDKQEHPLAADFSAPIALFWAHAEIKGIALLGAFRPKKTIDHMGLYFSEPYNPHKIPVLFTHGLMSSPDTFSNITNRLYADPVIRENYQFWFFGYPSGMAWLASAKDQRDAIAELAKEYDPKGTSPTFNNMVMVGHSMGGLITRMNNSVHAWGALSCFFKHQEHIGQKSYEQMMHTKFVNDHVTQLVRDRLVFNPIPQTKRIVFMATPHRGSNFADTWIGFIGRKLIRLPENILKEIARIGTLSSDIIFIHPGQLTQEFNSISQLSPSSPGICGLNRISIKPHTPVHTIMGASSSFMNSFHSSDGIVPYWSSHLSSAESECIVHSGHSVQATPQAALELRRILIEHLQKSGISVVQTPEYRIAPTLWQKYPPNPYVNRIPHCSFQHP